MPYDEIFSLPVCMIPPTVLVSGYLVSSNEGAGGARVNALVIQDTRGKRQRRTRRIAVIIQPNQRSNPGAS